MSRNLLIAASALALLAAPALAQTGSPSPSTTAQATSKADPLKQEDVKTGLVYQYIKQTGIFHCPIHVYDGGPNNETEYMTSYLMNGAVCGYGKLPSKFISGKAAGPGAYRVTAFLQPAEAGSHII